MKTKQVNPMPAFIDCEFDCEFKDYRNTVYGSIDFFHIGLLLSISKVFEDSTDYTMVGTQYVTTRNCRPRLNRPQVLPDWGWLDNPLLDGFVWGDWADQTWSSKEIATYYKQDLLRKPISFHICGVQKGSQLEEWAKENDVPTYNDDMEVVK